MRLANKHKPFCFLPAPFDDWRDITDPAIEPGHYFVNSKGEVFSFVYGQVLKPFKNHNGYLIVSLNANPALGLEEGHRYQRKIHRLVMMAFRYFEGCENFQVNHIDGDKTNNNLYNLEWCTAEQNIRHAEMTGLRTYENLGQKINAETAAFVKMLLAEGYTHKQILERIGPENITIVIIDNIARGLSWGNIDPNDYIFK